MNKLVSVVVPTYNSEKYLGECIESLLAQTYVHFELLLVNDGSTDNSLQICHTYAATDPRIKVYNQENKGVSAARNKGIDMANGEYICFVDADDLVSSEYINKLLRAIVSYKAELAICGHSEFNELNGKQKHVVGKQIFEQTNVETAISILSIQDSANLACWDKMFKLDIIKNNGIYFNTHVSIGEDSLFNIAYLEHATKTVSIPLSLYNYRINIDSTLRKDKKEAKFNPERMTIFQLARELNSIVNRMGSDKLKRVCGARIYINTRDAFSLYLKYENKDNHAWIAFSKQLRKTLKPYLLTIASTGYLGIKRVKKLPKDLCLLHAPSVLRLL